jgi:hypothetical protein
MNSSRKTARDFSPTLLICLVAFCFFLNAEFLRAQNPNSGTTTTGQILTVHITSPEDGVVFPGPSCETTVEGVVTLSLAARTNISVLYVIDVSGTTVNGFNFPLVDVNGDGVIDEQDNLNENDFPGDILDAEMAGALALNASIHNFDEVSVGLIAYAAQAASADVSPAAGFQNFISPPQADGQSNGVPDIEEVILSLRSDVINGGSIGKFTPIPHDSLEVDTQYGPALRAIVATFAGRPADEQKIVYFLSDGRDPEGPIDDEIAQAAAAGIIINTVGVTSNAEPDVLSQIAQGTGGSFTQVDNPADLRVVLPAIPLVGIAEVRVNEQPVTLSGIGTFATNVVLAPGANMIAATAIADDQTSATARISAACGVEPLTCELQILEPPQGLVICGNEVTVRAVSRASGGVAPIVRTCSINGVFVESMNDTLTATVAVGLDNRIVVVCNYIDAQGDTVTCQDTVEVRQPEALTCEIEITTPEEGAFVCDDSIDVRGVINVSGGIPPFLITSEVNGVSAQVSGNRFSVRVPLTAGENILIATSTVVDSCGTSTMCRATVRVRTSEPPECAVNIESPLDGAFVCGDSVTVTATTSILAGDSQSLQIVCDINGQPVTVENGAFSATIPLAGDTTLILATCTVTDDCGNTSICRDSIRVLRPLAPVAEVNLTSPVEGEVVCGDSLLVTATSTLAGGFPPFRVSCAINGIQAAVTDSLISATIPISAGDNSIVVVCTATDSCGRTAVSRDSVSVFRDDIPPTCTFKNEGLNIRGVFSDEHSGIASFTPLRLKNSKLTVDPFTAGAKSVSFLLEPIDPNKPTGFSIDIFDVCGNRFNCDPVFTRLEIDRARQIDFTFPSEDRYLQITNFGLTEVHIDLNGNKFQFTADLLRAQNQPNTFFLPREGQITIDLENYLHSGENAIFIAYDGPAAAAADLFLLDHVHDVDFILNLQTLPTEFQLAQNYPNPFNPTTRIRFDIPQRMSAGVKVQLKIYNLRGELVRVAMDEHKFPGQHVVEWDGRNQKGELAASGIYIYQLTAGEFRETKRMLLLK